MPYKKTIIACRRRCLSWIRNIPHRLAAIPKSPHEIAQAFAIGVFIGIIPGTGAAMALVVAIALRLSKTAAVLGALMTNPWTAAVFYAASFHVGGWFTRLEEPVAWRMLFTFQEDWPGELARIAPTMLIGAIALGLSAAGVSYIIVRIAVAQYRETRLRHRSAPGGHDLGHFDH